MPRMALLKLTVEHATIGIPYDYHAGGGHGSLSG